MASISCNNVVLISNHDKVTFNDKKGIILKIIGYLLFKSEQNEEDNILNFKLIGLIKNSNSDTNFEIGNYIITSDKAEQFFKCIYSLQENYSTCFYIDNIQPFPEGFYEEIFIEDQHLQNYFNKISEEKIKELTNTHSVYPLAKLQTILRVLSEKENKNETYILNSKMTDTVIDTGVNNIFLPLKKTSINTIILPIVEHYKIEDLTNRHECLKTDEEFEKQCAEIHEIRNSKFCLPMKKNDFIQSAIFNDKNYWDIPLLNKIDKFLKDEAIILDIGSNIGNHSLYWANERNAKLIYAFEPYPYSFKILEKNVKLNHLEERMKIFPFGISDEDSKGSVIGFCATNIGGTGFQKDINGDFDFKALDSLNIQEKIDLIKIDVEGAELEVLAGGMETIKKNLPIISIETFTNKNIIEEILSPLGYELVDDNSIMCDFIYACKDTI